MPDEASTILGKLSDEINRLTKRVAELEQRNQELETENKHLKDLLHRQGASKDAKAPQFKENYSVDKHKQRKTGATINGTTGATEVRRLSSMLACAR